MHDGSVERALERIGSARDLDELHAVLRDLRPEFGLAHLAYHALTLPGCDLANPLLILTYEQDWIDRYITQDYFRIDPVVVEGRRGFLPVDWSTVDRTSGAVREFFREAESYDVGSMGLTLPVRGPAGEHALFTVTANLSEREWQSRRLSYMRDFQILAHFVHDRAATLAGGRSVRSDLSTREAECLSLVVAGRQIKQIASECDLSVSAVQLYLRGARRKLGCTSLTEAAVKATRLELLPERRRIQVREDYPS